MFDAKIYRERFNEHQLVRRMGFVLEEVGDGTARVSCTVLEEWKNSQGILHGGVIASLIDVAIAAALKSLAGLSSRFSTVELKVNYLEPVDCPVVWAQARIRRKGVHTAFGVCEVVDEKGRLLSYGTGTFFIFEQEG
ncbi:MAG: PaaI family thioesterase [Deltaproteobacteria bacterium]|nr:MAG: PaaI family thioesterase [Deltaproteobacteria bacterium]